jgi:O-antigen ligase
LVAWPLAAFGGVYPWAYAPLAAGCALLAIVARPRFERDTRTLDVALCAMIGAALVQLVPLPSRLVAVVAPGDVNVQEALSLGALPSFIPLSIDPAATLGALVILSSAIALYWAARRTFATGGVRHVCRAISGLGLLLACVAIVQLGASRGRIYGFWMPQQVGAWPFGPFVNRNHAATWLIMAIPVCFGYLVARLRSATVPRPVRNAVLRHTLDGRTLWLIASLTVMLLALALSLSRSGMAALGLAAAISALLGRGRLDRVRTVGAAAVALMAVAAVLLFADTVAVVDRFGEAAESASGRMHIWRDTLRMAGALWLTGSGIGTYATAMSLFQTGDRAYYFNHAHNHFLQIAAEGGLLLAIPAAIALAALIIVARRRLASEEAGLLWIRAGAATGLVAVALQSSWETGLRVPANAILAGILAAIVTHRSRSPLDSGGRAWR